MARQKRPAAGDIMGLTLTLLVILIAFALLTAAMILDQELTATERAVPELARLERETAQAAADARSIARLYFGVIPPAESRLDTSISDDISEISSSLALFKGAVQSADVQRLLAGRTLPETWTDLSQAQRVAEDARRSLGALENALEGVGRNRDAATVVADLVAHNRELQIRNLQLIGQLANVERRSGFTGKPPCWVSPDGRPEYTYKITITDQEFVVEPLWSQDRTAELERIGAPVGRETIAYDDQEFSRAMYPFLAYGADTDPECRFFVQVVDDTGPFKGAWQERLALVEGYFYKYWMK